MGKFYNYTLPHNHTDTYLQIYREIENRSYAIEGKYGNIDSAINVLITLKDNSPKDRYFIVKVSEAKNFEQVPLSAESSKLGGRRW